jgi:nucleoside-diphosphate-sugar epimerase
MSKKTILIVGASGHLAPKLIQKFSDLQEYSCLSMFRNKSFAEVNGKINNFIVENYFDFIKHQEMLSNVDILIYVPTRGSNKEDKASAKEIWQVNYEIPIKLAEFVTKQKCKIFVSLGSLAEYEGVKQTPWNESQAINTTSEYARSKHEARKKLEVILSRSGAVHLHLRLASIFGEGEAANRIIPRLIDSSLSGEKFYLSSPGIIRNYLYDKDFVDWVRQIVEIDFQENQIINISSVKSVSNAELINLIQEITNSKIKIEPNSIILSEMDKNPIIVSAAKRLSLGLEEKYKLKSALEDLINIKTKARI